MNNMFLEFLVYIVVECGAGIRAFASTTTWFLTLYLLGFGSPNRFTDVYSLPSASRQAIVGI